MCFNQIKKAACFALLIVSVLAVPSSLLYAMSEDAAASALDPAHSPFSKGSRFWTVTGGASRDESLGWIALTQAGVSHYVIDNFALHYGATLGYANAYRTKGGIQGGPELGIRWHFLPCKRWSLHLDGIAGAVVHQNPLTKQSLRFNFDLQPGLGAMYHIDRNTMLQSGFRWHHLSNARIRGKARNLGYDGPMAYLGLMKSF